MRVSVIITCLGDGLFPGVGASAVRVLRALGCTVTFPPGQVCCGQPAFNSGYHDDAGRSAEAYVRAFAGSECVVSLSGSCAAMVRRYYPLLFAGGAQERAACELAERTFEFSEFLTDVLRVNDLPVTCSLKATLHASTAGCGRRPGETARDGEWA